MDKKQNINLREIRVVDFFDAINDNNIELIANSEAEFLDILFEYQEKSGIKMNGIELAKHRLVKRIELLSNLGYLLENNYFEQAEIDMLKSFNIEYNENDIEGTLKAIKVQVDRMTHKISTLKENDKSDSESANMDAYEIIATLSVALEFDLDYNSLSLSKFIALNKALKNKVKKE